MREHYSGIPEEILDSAQDMTDMARDGKIRLHLLGDTSQVRHGTVEDQVMNEYLNLLRTKMMHDILMLKGSEF